MISRGNLQPAHRGYRYQDIATAYVLVRSLVERFDSVTVDRKQVEDDRIDDLEVAEHGHLVRRQFKSSEDPNRAIATTDFTAAGSTLRIDRLALTFVRAGHTARATAVTPRKSRPRFRDARGGPTCGPLARSPAGEAHVSPSVRERWAYGSG